MGLLLALSLYMISWTTKHTSGCSDVELVPRAEWGARVSKENDTMRVPVPHLFIHHTAGPQCTSKASCVKIMQGIQNYHMDDLDWDDIGYNFLVGGDGRAYEGRGWKRVGAHTYGFNRVSVAISLMGDFSKKPPSPLMLRTALAMVDCAVKQGHVTKDYRLHGHRDGGCTECPGDALYAIIRDWPRFQGGPLPGKLC